MNKLSILLVMHLLVACATKHPGSIATPINPDPENKLIVSAKVAKDYSDPYNVFIDVAFENNAANWLRIDEIELEFSNSDNLAHNIIIGQDLYSWAESFEEKKKVDDHNTALAINSLILGGAILAGTSRSSTPQAVGAVAMIGGLGWDATRSYMNKLNKAQRSLSVPEKHIYRPFTVPAAGLIRRWFIVNTPSDRIVKSFNMKISTVDGKVLNYEVPIKF